MARPNRDIEMSHIEDKNGTTSHINDRNGEGYSRRNHRQRGKDEVYRDDILYRSNRGSNGPYRENDASYRGSEAPHRGNDSHYRGSDAPYRGNDLKENTSYNRTNSYQENSALYRGNRQSADQENDIYGDEFYNRDNLYENNSQQYYTNSNRENQLSNSQNLYENTVERHHSTLSKHRNLNLEAGKTLPRTLENRRRWIGFKGRSYLGFNL